MSPFIILLTFIVCNFPDMYNVHKKPVEKFYLARRYGLFNFELDVNVVMRMLHGNGRDLLVLYQNIPGTYSSTNTISKIETILDKFKPHVLGIAEPVYNDMNQTWDGYDLIQGYLNNGTKIRLNALVRNDLNYEVVEFKTEVPSILIKTGSIKIILCYREWSKEGNLHTSKLDLQLD